MDPLSIAMIVSSLVGTGLQGKAAQKDARAKNAARQAALRSGVERGREFEKRGFEVTRKAAESERSLKDLQTQKKDEALALMAVKDRQPPESRLGMVQAAQGGQAAESAAKVIGSGQATSALKRKQAESLMPLGEIIRAAQRDWGVTQQEAVSAGQNASGGRGMMTIGQLLKFAPLMAGFASPSTPLYETGTVPSIGNIA